ncbi:MAG: hypothetical protein ABI779_23770 [Acidobacteriota bacterium]
MTCPYSEPNCAPGPSSDGQRCLCGRYVKHCSYCGIRNRAFANHCRGCAIVLQPSNSNWSGYKGGSRRLGASAPGIGTDCLTRLIDLRLRLGDSCRGLLGHDGHVVAVSLNGVVEIADPTRARSVCRFQVQGPMTAEPCIQSGVLHLATRGQVSAYALASITLETPRVQPLWQVELNGTPIQALTPAGNRLYVTVATPDGREIHVIEDHQARLLYSAPKVSWVAADPATTQAVFLSETNGVVQMHLAGDGLTSHPLPLHSLGDHPIALLGDTVFGVFGDTQRLYRLDARTGTIQEPLEEDTQLFALTNDGDTWDRDSVCIDTRGIVFARRRVRDSFAPYERATRGSPVIVQDSAVAVGMEDGRVLIYDLARLPHHDVWRLGDTPITALASFDSYIVAGNKDGLVEVRELQPRGPAQ